MRSELRDCERDARRFRALITASNDVVYRMSPDWSTMRQLQGQGFLANTETDNPRWLQEYIPDRDKAAVTSAIEEAVRTKGVFELEHGVYREDGSVGWTHSRAVPLLDEEGEVSEWFGFASDITERVHAEEALRDARYRTEADLEAMTRLQELGGLFVRGGDLGPVLTEVVEAGIAIAHADFGNCQLLDPESGCLKIVAQCGFPQWWLDHWEHVPEGHAACGTALAAGKRAIIEDVTQSPVFAGTPDLDVQLRAGVRAVVSTPLIGRSGDPLGMISFHFGQPHRPDDRTLALVDLLARQAADIVERAHADEERTEQATYAEALNAINDAIHSTLDFDEIMNRVVVEANTAFGSESASIVVKRDDSWIVSYDTGFDSPITGLRIPEQQRGFMETVERANEPIIVEDATKDPRLPAGWVQRFSFRSFLAVPLSVRGEMLGVMFFNFHRAPRPISSAKADFARKLSPSVSLALENARRFEAEHDVADRLQEALLTLPDEVPGIEFAHAYHSAAEVARVGGDFYDLFPLNHNHVGLVIGDVAGKGLDAAVLTSMVKNTVRAHANERGKTPRKILQLTNEIVFKATPTESFVTVFFGILDCRDGRLVYSNAGHTTAAVVREDGSAGKLPVTGPLLGAFGNVEFDQAETCLDLDELLFLYTDGLTEARRENELFGEDRLFSLLGTTGAGSAKDVVQQVIREVMAFTGNRLRDDLAILAVKRVRHGAETPHQQKLEM